MPTNNKDINLYPYFDVKDADPNGQRYRIYDSSVFSWALVGGYENNQDKYITTRKNLIATMVTYTVSGKARLKMKGVDTIITPGSLCIIDLYNENTIEAIKGSNWEIYYLHFAGIQAKLVANAFQTYFPDCVFKNFKASKFLKAAKQLIEIGTSKHPAINRMVNISQDILLDIVEQYSKIRKINIDEYRDLIRNNLALEIKDIAKMAGYSEEHFNRLFKKNNKISAKQYQIKERIYIAKNLMDNKNLSLKEIAYQSGFSSLSNMYYTFIRETGVNPSIFRFQYV